MAVIRSVLNTWNGRHRVTDMCYLHLLQGASSFRVTVVLLGSRAAV